MEIYAQMYSKIFILMFALVGTSFAQKAATWWTPGEYLKFPITEKGIYEISVDDLKKSSKKLATNSSPNGFHLYRMGVRIPVLVRGNSLLFFGEPNDGKADSAMYLPTSAQPHQFTSLFSDTAFYYIKFDPALSQNEIQKNTMPQGDLPILTTHFQQERKIFNNEWTFSPRSGPLPDLESPYFEEGEIFTSPIIKKDSIALQNISLTDFDFSAKTNPRLTVQINGRDNFEHRVLVQIGKEKNALKQVDSLQFYAFKARNSSFEIPLIQIENENFWLATRSKGIYAFDRYSLNYYELSYPQKFKAKLNQSYYFRNQTDAKIVVTGFESANVFQITKEGKITQSIAENGSYFIAKTKNETQVFIGNPIKINQITATEFQSFENFTANFIIITTPSFNESANGFAQYRASKQGGGYETAVVNIRQLYDQFNYGIRSALAIRNFDEKLANLSEKQRFQLLIGQGRSIYDNKWAANPEARDPVPAFGFPGSDNIISAGIKGASPFIPRYATGRLSTVSNVDAMAYLAKVIAHESATENLAWRKKILHLSGGRSSNELVQFKSILDGFVPSILAGPIGGKVETVSKQTIDPVEKLDISSQINAGVGLLTFFGHSNPSGADIDIGTPTDAARGYQNTGRLPFMFFNGCGLGNTFFGATPLSTNWLLTPQKGAVLVLSHSYSGYVSPLAVFMKDFYETITDEKFVNQPFGLVHQEVIKRNLKVNTDEYVQINAMLMNIQGDPAIRFFPFEKSDYGISSKQIFLQTGTLKTIAQSDSVSVGLLIDNFGKYIKNEVLTTKISVSADGKETIYNLKNTAVAFQDTVFLKIKRPTTTSFKISVSLDDANQIAELNEKNNQAELNIENSQLSNLTLFPASIIPDKTKPLMLVQHDETALLNEQIISLNAELNLLLQDDRALMADKTNITLQIRDCKTCEYVNFNANDHAWNYENDRTLRLTLKNLFKKTGDYSLLLQGFDASKNKANFEPIRFDLKVIQADVNELLIYPNPASFYIKTKLTLDKEQNVSIQLIDNKGIIVSEVNKKQKIGTSTQTMDLSNLGLANGLYYLRISTESKVLKTEKIVILK
jgi:hypothetical protein